MELLSPGGIILTALSLVLAFITWRQRSWKSTADAAVAEMNVHKEANARLRDDVKTLHVQVADLSKQRDLEPLITTVINWVDEGRKRFERAENGLNSNTAALTELIREIQAQRATSEDAYRQLTASFMAHTLEDKEIQLEATRARLRVAEALDEIERRLSQVAVKVGVVKWETQITKT